jgi:uncharacterized protein (DUF1501 family)
MTCSEHMSLSRRRLMTGGATLALWAMMPRIASASGRDPRLLTVVLRGGLDGMSMVAPIGDPDYARIRGNLAIPTTGESAGLALDGFFSLNAAMPFLHGLYRKGQALFVHAAATPYRGRSHFDGQDVLESGIGGEGRVEDGWLNRALMVMPAEGRVAPLKGLSIGALVPLIMRGKAPALSMSTPAYNTPLRDATAMRLLDLYRHTDPKLADRLSAGLELEKVAGGGAAKGAGANKGAGPRPFNGFIVTAEAATRFLTQADGPRIGALAYDGWDTHANEGAVAGVLANQLMGLDHAIRTLHDGMGATWQETCVLIVTEFGRTARINGTNGTDHGTATVAVLIGGAVKGGRVVAEWPGLSDAALHEGRDLKPTRDMRALFKGVLRDHLGIPAGLLASTVFPDSVRSAPMDGLLG